MHVESIYANQIFYPLQKAMDILGFTPNEVSGVLELLSGILNLGNFRFSGYSLPNGTDACTLTETDPSESSPTSH